MNENGTPIMVYDSGEMNTDLEQVMKKSLISDVEEDTEMIAAVINHKWTTVLLSQYDNNNINININTDNSINNSSSVWLCLFLKWSHHMMTADENNEKLTLFTYSLIMWAKVLKINILMFIHREKRKLVRLLRD